MTLLGTQSLRRRAPRQRGAAVFIVVMTLLMLSAIGVWSMHSANIVDRASGYSRAAMQTQYLSEMGTLATTGLLAVPGFAEANVQPTDRDACLSTPNSTFCKSLFLDELAQQTDELTGAVVTDVTTDEGSFGPLANELQGHFRVELTDPVPVVMAGTDIGGGAVVEFRRYTLTSYGTVRPFGTGAVGVDLCTIAGASQAQANSAAGTIAMRSHAILGPFPKGN
jgi:hypothetical protein